MKTHPRVIVTILFVLVLALGLALLMVFLRRESELLVFRDSFESELQKGWSIFNEDPTHYSLVKRTGSLTVTTQSGGIYAGARNARNLFLLENPLTTDEDFEILISLSSFTPVAEFQQAGLLCFDDPDNYVKACYLFSRRYGGPSLHIMSETQGRPAGKGIPFAQNDKLWLRLSKTNSTFALSTSTNGKDFEESLSLVWRSTVKHVGLFAKNSNVASPPATDAVFEFFELRRVRSQRHGTGRTRG